MSDSKITRPYRGRATTWATALFIAQYVAHETGVRMRVRRDFLVYAPGAPWLVTEVDTPPEGRFPWPGTVRLAAGEGVPF